MSFKHPEILYLLIVILIPIIIHLFNFRRYKKLLFSNIEFLKNITTTTRKQNKLKHLIVLLSRILAIVFLVLAFSGPEFGEDKVPNAAGKILTAIYLDNSFSMMSQGEEGRMFDEAMEVAHEIVKLEPRDRQFIFLNNQIGINNRLLNKEGMQAEIDEQAISPARMKISEVLTTTKRIAADKDFTETELYLLSDFQKSTVDAASLPEDTINTYYFLPFSPLQKRNIFIDSCWISQPLLLTGKQVILSLRVRNASNEDYEKIPLKLSIDNKQKAVAAVDIPALGSKDISFTISPAKPGWQTGVAEIEDYPVSFDDNYFFTFFVSNKIDVLELYDSKPSFILKQFYNSDSVFNFSSTNFRRLNYSRLDSYKLIILNSLTTLSSGLINQLEGYMMQGGNILFVPPVKSDFNDENDFLQKLNAGKIILSDTSKTRVVSIKDKDDLFRNVVLAIPENAAYPYLTYHVKYAYALNTGLESLAVLLDGSDFLLKKKVGGGSLFLLSVPLSLQKTNFVTNALFVPVMYGIATAHDVVRQIAFTIDNDRILETDLRATGLSDIPFSMQSASSGYSFIPEQKILAGKMLIDVHDGINIPGFYQLVLNDSVYKVFGFNFNRDESVMDFYNDEQLKSLLEQSGLKNYELIETVQKDYSEVLGSIQKESELWKLFIIFALLFLLAEVLILRFWK